MSGYSTYSTVRPDGYDPKVVEEYNEIRSGQEIDNINHDLEEKMKIVSPSNILSKKLFD